MTMTLHSVLITIESALEPSVPNTQILTISINQGSKQTAQWIGAQARATENGAHHMVTAHTLAGTGQRNGGFRGAGR